MSRTYMPDTELEAGVIYTARDRQGFYYHAKTSDPVYGVSVNGHVLMAGQLLNEAQARTVLRDALDAGLIGGYPKMEGVSYTQWQADGAGELTCSVLLNECATPYTIVLDRMGKVVLWKREARGSRMVGWGTRIDCMKEVHRQLKEAE